ncbi:hypothetical protein [Pectobacterium parmentieri]|uniref:hypothetical protein n=1 Tax=Pectobacterium parmentieri TaxID=1905730 RepID=UPI000F8E9BC0|nr:hypothetical protein [Pectobacterium parmentieri]AZS56761.1 hypothetical protein C5E18_11825 [Pectobacterium parmentieri]MBI0431668.1 hypothetical protein [Pectobacterium parmentieri]
MTTKKLDINAYLENEARLSEIVTVDDTHILINIPGEHIDGEYSIALVSCSTAEQLVGWIFHLTEKSWITNDILRRFIKEASANAGIDL